MKRRALPMLTIVILLVGQAPALAHNQKVHQDMTDLAYQIMVLAEIDPTLVPTTLPPGLSALDWGRFRVDMIRASNQLRGLDLTLKTPMTNVCIEAVDGIATTLPADWSRWPSIGTVDQPLAHFFGKGRGCGLYKDWAPDGIYAGNFNANAPNFAGPLLGHLAGAVDDEFDDTHLWFRPANAGILGAGPAIAATNEATDIGIAIVLAPFICIASWITGGDDCIKKAKDLADSINPIDELAGAIPGVGDISGPDWTGVWHHINVTPGRSNDYDNDQGLLFDEAGFLGAPDAVEIALIAAFDISGLSLDSAMSRGVRRYPVENGGDFHPDTRHRSDFKWQFHTMAHTPMEPVDNLAFFGWQRFRDLDRDASHLAWPLHALGDSVSPMHTIGSAGWGHRPFEDWVQMAWPQVTFNPATPSTTDLASQRAQAIRIVTKALEWRKFILDWRLAHPGHDTDMPIRDFVTAVAQETYDYAESRMFSDLWPFDPIASTSYVLNESRAIEHYRTANGPDLVRPLIENGVAAKIAFLTTAVEAK